MANKPVLTAEEYQRFVDFRRAEDEVCGYRNFETFTMIMEITNNREKEYLEAWKEEARQALEDVLGGNSGEDDTFSRRERAELSLSDVLKEAFDEEIKEDDTWQHSLLTAAFERVDWLEVARELLPEEGLEESSDLMRAEAEE